MRRQLVSLIVFTLVVAACASDSAGESSQDVTTDTADDATSDTTDESASGEDAAEPDEAEPDDSDSAEAVTDEPEPDDAEADEVPEETGCAAVVAGDTRFSFDAGGATHSVRVFVPSSFAGEPLPVVLNWHGLGSNGPEQATYSDYETLAEAEGFLVAHPTGVPAEGDDRNSWELEQFDSPERDDLEFADALIDTMIADFCADESRVYSTGMSNGGFFTARLVCERSERIAAAVSVAGTSHFDGCEPTRAVPYLAYHGTADAVVPFSGGDSTLLGSDAEEEQVQFFQQVMPLEVAQFAESFECSLEPVVTTVSDEVIQYDYEGCRDDVPVSFVEVIDGAHTWPGSPLGDAFINVLGYGTNDVSATADGWAFMSQFSLDS